MELKPVDISYGERVMYPIVPVVVVAGYGDEVGGMFAAWWSQLSFNPFLVGVLVAPERYTYKLLMKSDVFSFNYLDFKYVDKAPYLGDVSERFLKKKIKRAGFTIKYGEKLGAPYIGEASAMLELRKRERIAVGDHDLFVGEVVAAYATDDFKNGMWELESYRPTMYLGRTRRPDKVYRVYLTPVGYDFRRLEFAGGGLRRFSFLRNSVRNEIRKIVKGSGSLSVEELVKKLRPIADKYSLDEEDLRLYIEDLRRKEQI